MIYEYKLKKEFFEDYMNEDIINFTEGKVYKSVDVTNSYVTLFNDHNKLSNVAKYYVELYEEQYEAYFYMSNGETIHIENLNQYNKQEIENKLTVFQNSFINVDTDLYLSANHIIRLRFTKKKKGGN